MEPPKARFADTSKIPYGAKALSEKDDARRGRTAGRRIYCLICGEAGRTQAAMGWVNFSTAAEKRALIGSTDCSATWIDRSVIFRLSVIAFS